MVLDEYNRAIVAALQLDGRRPYADIAKEVGLSEAAVRQRVKKMTTAGILQIVAVTDQMQMGYRRPAMLAITIEGDTAPVTEKVAAIAEVDYLVATAGSVDLLAEVVAVDDADLYRLVSLIRAIPGVRTCETHVYFAIHKQTYQWGAR
jgi:Lrp/AsnC family transcriptional regulator for asnA, asnC and gidA